MNEEVFWQAGQSSPDEVKSRLRKEALAVEAGLTEGLRGLSTPEGLREAMSYSLMAGGKRIRPVLLLVSARLFGLQAELSMSFAMALECIHTYSLIHDDLPAMDDDDLRRGRPSCHKQFDEATAILAGDGLLTDAFALMTGTKGVPAERVLLAARSVALAAGSPGMVGGQFLDICYTAKEGVRLESLAVMHAMKTGALIRAACVAGAQLGGADAAGVQAMATYGEALGAAFQIIDDILDATGKEEELGKPVGSDLAKGKTTYASLLGLEKSRALAEEKTSEAVLALRGFAGEEARFLRGLAVYILQRIA
jgi:geranylgeranyl diphosphate synthase type II